ncbi:MAG: DUF5666 domain-containing protein [Porticoccus sp.]|nr:DUF5666 domain-containing protein [Porticoccus sp.]
MLKSLKIMFTCAALSFSTMVFSDDLEGVIESIALDSQSLVVQGIRFYATEKTDYDDGLKGFADLKSGQVVEVDFNYQEGKHYATEIELERDAM